MKKGSPNKPQKKKIIFLNGYPLEFFEEGENTLLLHDRGECTPLCHEKWGAQILLMLVTWELHLLPYMT